MQKLLKKLIKRRKVTDKMFTIALDESGSFEVDNNLRFIGGLIYDGEDYNEESKRLELFFDRQCKLLGLNYPSELHSTEIKKYKKHKILALKKLQDNLIKYLRDRGKYNILCMLKPKDDRTDYGALSNIIDDKNAGNLYEHMACQLLNNTIVHSSIFYKKNLLNIHVATRSLPIKKSNVLKVESFKELGYSYNKDKNKKEFIFYLTDQRTFKSAISSKLTEIKLKQPPNIKLNVKPINYENGSQKDIFLYGADLVCDIIRKNLDLYEKDYGIGSFMSWVKKSIKTEALVWVYDDIDGLYNSLIKVYEEKDYIKCLELIYDINCSASLYRDHYLKTWINKIEKNLCKIFKEELSETYVKIIEPYFSKDKGNYLKGKFAAERLYKELKEYNRPIAEYKLSDILLRACNHFGNSSEGRLWFERCEELKRYVTLEEYINTLIRAVEIEVNSFRFNKALDKIENINTILDFLRENRKEVAKLLELNEPYSFSYELRGKALSSIGQFYSFVKDYKKALKYLEEALEEFPPHHNVTNRQVTLSYILHLAIISDDKKLYKKYEMEYYHSVDVKEQLNIIIDKKDNPKDFMFYAYTKALNYFYGEQVPEDILKILNETDYIKKGFKTNQHPWELIYREIAEINFKKAQIDNGQNFINNAVEAVKDGGYTIEMINKCSNIVKELESNNIGELTKRVKSFITDIKKHCMEDDFLYDLLIYERIDNETEVIKAAKAIISKFTYMYC
ncbi:hypothetical protein [Clostridium polynesiense]|uniref:hypothetical protein n=1 Tax=Clostridium polynesiense TaxID=1325933 RepID=UPI0011CA8D8E|nr:hypothetical protein [Clostridium polynesiense]